MPSDEFLAHLRGNSAHLNNIGWENYYGTTNSGNLPQYLVNENPCEVDVAAVLAQPGINGVYEIDNSTFRYYHIKCPFSNESTHHYILDRNIYSPTFGQSLEIVPSQRSSHTVTQGIMIKDVRGSKYGWVCVDNNCKYYIGNPTIFGGTTSGIRYFYY